MALFCEAVLGLPKSQTNSAQLKKAVESLTMQLSEKQQRIDELQAELASKNIRIQELGTAISGLTAEKEVLAEENEAQAAIKHKLCIFSRCF